MESQAVQTDPQILAENDEIPQVPLKTTSSTPESRPSDHGYQRDEQFHIGLKQAASRRRQIAKSQEHQSFVRHSQEAAIARALHAAATAFCLPNASEFDDSFFYAAIDLAMKGSKIPLDCSRGQNELSRNSSDDLSLPDMIDVMVNRSTRTIIQQREEIYCLRLVVRELMQELLSADGDGEVSRTTTSHASSPSRFESPKKKYDPAILPIEEASSLMTPTTANTTIATPDSIATTPQTFQAFGSTHSYGTNNRHLVSPKYLSNNSLSMGSMDGSNASPRISKLKDVQRSLDATMQETEQNREGFMTKLDGADMSVLFDRETRLPNKTSSLQTTQNNGLADQPSTTEPSDISETAIRSMHTSPASLPDSIQRSSRLAGATNSIERTLSGRVVESILDTIIEKSMEIVGNEACFESRRSSNPKQVSWQAGTYGDDSNLAIGVDLSARNIMGIDNSDRTLMQKTVESQVSDPWETAESLLKVENLHVDPPARLTRVESATMKVENLHVDPPARLTRVESAKFDDEAVLLSSLGEPETDFAPKRWSVDDSNESDTHKPHIFEDREQDDDSENNPSDSNDGERRMVVLISTAITNPLQTEHQEQAMAILRDKDIEVEFVDGADPTTEEIRECLFVVSGISQVYPQFFIVDDDGMTEFLGNFEELKHLHDSGELRSAILGISTASGARQEEPRIVGHQEEKKDEQAANVMTEDQAPNLSSRSWDQRTHMTEGQKGEETDYLGATEQVNGEESRALDDIIESDDLPIFIRDEGFSWIDPSPLYINEDPPSFGKLAVIKEDPTGVNESFLSTKSSEVNSSDESFEEGSRKLRWV